MYTIALTGGTGTLGRLVAGRLADAGVLVRVLSRKPPATAAPASNILTVVGDLCDVHGIGPALHGVGSIVHCASDPRRKGAEVQLTRHLIDAARQVDPLPHLVYISIVGVDKVPLEYYRDKLAAEELIHQSGLPWTILRATQFHEFIVKLLQQQLRSPVLAVPARTSAQPIAADEVAQRLVDLAIGPARGRVDDLAGPQVRTAAELATTYLKAIGKQRFVLPILVPGPVGRGYRAGGHLAPDRAVGHTTFEEFLTRTR